MIGPGESAADVHAEIDRLVTQRVEQEEQEAKAHGRKRAKDAEAPGSITSKFIRECAQANALGDAYIYAELWRGQMVYDHFARQWLLWSGHHWVVDREQIAQVRVDSVAKVYLYEAILLHQERQAAEAEGDKRGAAGKAAEAKDMERRAWRLRNKAGRDQCLEFAAACKDGLGVAGDLFDAKPWFLGCVNGVVNLRTGDLRDGKPDDYLIKASPVEFKGLDEPAPTWEQALNDIFQGCEPVIRYVQRLMGYGITGLVSEGKMPVFWGKGRNGKSLIINVITEVLGPLAGPIPAEMLLEQKFRSSSGPTPDIMSLRGLRLAFASETDDGCKLSASKVKLFTGGDKLQGRNPHDKYTTNFNPTHLLLLLTNHKPYAGADDFALWARIQLVEFGVSFVDWAPAGPNERPVDKDLETKLEAEKSGILAWCVRGCLEWQRMGGLHPPEEVLVATEEYREEEDDFQVFLDECCYDSESATVSSSDVWDRFREWWANNISKKVPTRNKMGRWLRAKGYERFKSGTFHWRGIGLKST